MPHHFILKSTCYFLLLTKYITETLICTKLLMFLEKTKNLVSTSTIVAAVYICSVCLLYVNFVLFWLNDVLIKRVAKESITASCLVDRGRFFQNCLFKA